MRKLQDLSTVTINSEGGFMDWMQVAILSLIEGITEFLPISSTGHLILTSAFFGIQDDGFVKAFNIIIQFGAIASVLVIYRQRFFQWRPRFFTLLTIAVLPAVILGFLVKKKIEALLGDAQVVSWALILGGILLILSDRWFRKQLDEGQSVDELTYKQGFLIGLAQCFAFIPGVSRSAASILGGLALGLKKQDAAEFSFFLAVPTLAGATLLNLFKIRHELNSDHISRLVVGSLLSFFVAWLAIKFFIHIVSKFGFSSFGIYRILLGLITLLFLKH
jgi:undecaprenyl-diphosphatase